MSPLPGATPAMRRVLVNMFYGRDAWEHLSGRSMHGGAGQTERAMLARGWITWDGETKLTEAGINAALACVAIDQVSDACLDRLIQTHSNLDLVERLRAERTRRSAVATDGGKQ